MIQAIVTDIEGTTSSLSFVKDVLFPYARAHLPAYVAEHAHDPTVRQLLNDANQEAGGGLNDAAVVQTLISWIDADKKATPLKSLQGLIWEHGYKNGDFTGHVYKDAYENLQTWYARGIRLYVYSSGSVYAQKLLFGFSDFGDMTPLFSGYFDTHIGHKREAEAYRHIVKELQLPASNILFLSDIKEELDAAKTAGMQTGWLVRDGNLPDSTSHLIYRDFNEVTQNILK